MSTWEHHYTGIDVKQSKHLYLQRDSTTKKVTFARFNLKKFYAGAFIGRLNNAKYSGRGIELFTRKMHVALIIKDKVPTRTLHWSGSIKSPYNSFTVFIWRFAFGMTTPKWLEQKVRHYKEKQFDEHFRSML